MLTRASLACAALLALTTQDLIAAGFDSDHITARVEEAARERLAQQVERAGLLDPQFDVAVVTRKALPACPVAPQIDSIDLRQPSRMRFALDCAGQWRQEVIVRGAVTARVLVASADIPAGQPLSAADVMLERRSLQSAPDALSDAKDIAGMSSRRALRAGDNLRRSWLVAPLLVKRGDAIRILARHDQIEVSVAGVAMENGAKGATISVRNAANNNVIQARVIAAGTVEPITMPGPTAQSPD